MPKTNIADRVAALDVDARDGLQIVFYNLLTMLENGKGGSVTLMDEKGDGHISVLSLGEQMLVSPLLSVAGDIHDSIYEVSEGTIH